MSAVFLRVCYQCGYPTPGPHAEDCPDVASGVVTVARPVAPKELNVLRARVAIDAEHLARQRDFSRRTFGPGKRTQGVIDHIRKELIEIEANPTDLGEWVDVIILALDGAWRAGWEPQQIIDAVKAKQTVNEARTWPDWRTASESVAIEHDRTPQEESHG